MKKKKKGFFIAIDGTDGSGKATQTSLLIKKLEEKGHDVRRIDFPQYGSKSAALVEEYLNGEFGTAEEVGPYRASIFYACDRYAASAKIKKWLNDGKIIISNRYVTANMGHQGGKIREKKERRKYFKWLYNLEYDIFSIPKPDISIILHVDAGVAQNLAFLNKKLGYLTKKRRDIHESDLGHLRNAEKIYIEIAKTFPGFVLIECMDGKKIMSRERISDLIWKKLIKKINF